MGTVFLKLLNLSITASWLILAVIFVRLFLKRAPKGIFCVLWALVAIRLICPFSLESRLSLILKTEWIPEEQFYETETIVLNTVDVDAISESYPDTVISATVQHPEMTIKKSISPIGLLPYIWLAGIVVLLLYALISYIKLKKCVGASISIKGDILVCDEVKFPFILGIMKPLIYVPSSMDGETLDYVITHEMAHIKRRDHWWKPFGFLLLTVYWFNPLCWVAYILFCRDIEIACDEKVIRKLDNNGKVIYSQALLNCSFPRRRIAVCPVAFGEIGVKERVKAILNYEKPAFWIIVVAIVTCIVIGVCFLTSPKNPRSNALPLMYSHSYGVVEVTYETSGTDFSMVAQQSTPVYAITENMQLMSKGEYSSDDEWTALGALVETKLTKENFDDLFHGGHWFVHESASIIRKNTVNAWTLIYNQNTLYYVLQQKNGEVYLAYGYYDYLEKDDPGSDDTNIRWLFKLAYDIREDMGIIATSGENVIPVVVFPTGTAISDVKDSLFWLDIEPGSDELVPFTIFCNGYEQYGMYSIYDAETMEYLDFFHPSGLSPQTYLFQNAEYGHNYIITLLSGEKALLCFGARIGNAANLAFDGSPSAVDALRKRYPEYFDLPTAKGLEIYVWQMSQDSYSFGVLPGTNRVKSPEELWNLKGVSAEEMKAILSMYDVNKQDISICPWQNPISSYIAEYWIMQEGEDQSAISPRRQAYVDNIYKMLFD